MTLDELEKQLRADAWKRGVVNGQIWHEADIDGFHLYMSDTSFGDGPVFSIQAGGMVRAFQCPEEEWVPLSVGTTVDDLDWIMPIAARADWQYRLNKLDPTTR